MELNGWTFSAKESPKTTHAAAPEAQKPTGPPTTPAVKTAVPPPPPENVWEKRMEERQKSAERDNGIQVRRRKARV